jgi:hypothetical protein
MLTAPLAVLASALAPARAATATKPFVTFESSADEADDNNRDRVLRLIRAGPRKEDQK